MTKAPSWSRPSALLSSIIAIIPAIPNRLLSRHPIGYSSDARVQMAYDKLVFAVGEAGQSQSLLFSERRPAAVPLAVKGIGKQRADEAETGNCSVKNVPRNCPGRRGR